MRKRVTLFIVAGDQILLIHRLREGDSYFVVPGGGVEEGETVIEAAHREAAEETGLQIELGGLLWERPFTTLISNGEEIQQVEYAYLITQFSGEPCLGGPEFERQSETNRYSLAWLPLAEFPDRFVYPSGTDIASLLKALNNR